MRMAFNGDGLNVGSDDHVKALRGRGEEILIRGLSPSDIFRETSMISTSSVIQTGDSRSLSISVRQLPFSPSSLSEAFQVEAERYIQRIPYQPLLFYISRRVVQLLSFALTLPINYADVMCEGRI